MYAVRSRSGRVLRRFATRGEAERFVRRGRTAHSPGEQLGFAPHGRITDVLGNTRPIEHIYENGDWNCPFCMAAVLTPNDERYRQCGVRGCDKIHCQNPACHANIHFSVERAREQEVAAAARRTEEEERARNREWQKNYAEEQRKERETQRNAIINEADRRGACPRHALLGFPYQKPKYVKHRGACPLGRR